jgi:hypothetical protein
MNNAALATKTPANSNNGRSLATADKAALIRAALKKQHGWTSRQVSVRSDVYSMGSTLRIKIKSADVSITAVRMIAGQFEKVARCEVTGDILSGGNTYLDVEYDHDVVEPIALRIEAKLLNEDTVEVLGYRVFCSDPRMEEWRAWSPNDEVKDQLCRGKRFMARTLAILALDAGMEVA